MEATVPLNLDASIPLGRWLPDETLFSLASRFHRVSGHRLASTTCQALFGHPYQGSAHDLPSRIDEFVARTEGRLGLAVDIIRQRTVLPYFLPFQDTVVARSAEASLRGQSIGHLKFQLGLLTSRFRAHLPLKACHACIAEDRANFGVAYWHRIHQFPGVWLCPTHSYPLAESALKSTGIKRFGWHLPSEGSLCTETALTETKPTSALHEKLSQLSSAAVALGSLPPDFHFDSVRLTATYRFAIEAKGLAGKHGRLRISAVGASYLESVDGLDLLDELSAIPRTSSQSTAQVVRLLYPARAGAHPLRHLLLILWLYGDWQNFWNQYHTRESTLVVNSVSNEKSSEHGAISTHPEREIALNLIRATGCTATKAARELGVDVSTVMAWLAASGITTARRPKKLKIECWEALISQLRGGLDKAVVADNIGISITTVTRILRTEVGLRDAWRSARHDSIQKRSRNAWNELAKSNPNMSLRSLRLVAPDAYAWLYRNDRAWLMAFNESHRRPIKNNATRVNWDARDASFALSVKQELLRRHAAGLPSRISIVQFCCAIPGLKEKLGQLERLPLTLQALAGLSRRRRLGDDSSLL